MNSEPITHRLSETTANYSRIISLTKVMILSSVAAIVSVNACLIDECLRRHWINKFLNFSFDRSLDTSFVHRLLTAFETTFDFWLHFAIHWLKIKHISNERPLIPGINNFFLHSLYCNPLIARYYSSSQLCHKLSTLPVIKHIQFSWNRLPVCAAVVGLDDNRNHSHTIFTSLGTGSEMTKRADINRLTQTELTLDLSRLA